ncbi:MAG: DUF3320 domain-containing protein [Oscillospiraceae bacterium]|nr:DUF3320 domain-containing protein [Oscillospiraceae bacterium]
MENKISFSVQLTGAINYAMQQNYIPVVRSIVLTNNTVEAIKDITIKISSEPEFIKPFQTDLAQLLPGEPVEISPVKLVISSEFLFSLTERLNGSIHFEVLCGGEKLAEDDSETALLPYDYWQGGYILPELTAAFVTPNHPRIEEVTSKAGMYLKKWTGDPSFTGYQSRNPNIAKKQIAAVYAALQEENIAYRNPPASFERLGQRVRMPYSVLEQKGGTCLDLALLMASCLEAVGLNPLVILIKGHAFCGCWLEEQTFDDCAVDDISALTKRTADGMDMLCLIECTDYVAGKNTDFDRAEKHANDNLSDPSDFNVAIDITRCRGNGIRPMPARVAENGVFKAVDYGKRKSDEITSVPKEIDLARHAVLSDGNVEITRKTLWERKLLDLSLRNTLLNFRPTSGSVQFMTSDLAVLEDAIAGGESFKIMPAPSEISLALSDSKIFEIENEKDLVSAISESEFKSHRIRTFIPADQLEQVMKKIHRAAKVSIEENGANTLYLALGFLRWFETERSERPRYAPLVLIPVDIIRKIQDRSYSLRIRDEETQMNITLLEMLRQDFGIDIKGLDPLPLDDSGVDIPLIFNTIRSGVMSKRHWDIEEIAFLGQFSFSQFIMWNDIRKRSDELEKNKVVSSLISGKMNWQSKNAVLTPHQLDETLKPSDMAVPMDADSSQLAAVYQAEKGESFVLHGPPGTGKSQTITNMIANALYNGKSVLFVAEKMAALSVVQKRLASIGLDPFCLELHSNKTQKKAVLSQLEKTLSIGHIKPPEEYAATAEKLLKLRRELNSAMENIHRIQPAGISLYTAIIEADKFVDHAGKLDIPVELFAGVDRSTADGWRGAVHNAATALMEHDYASSPLKEYRRCDYSPELRENFSRAAASIANGCEAASEAFRNIAAACGLDIPAGYQQISDCVEIFTEAVSSELLPRMLTNPPGQQECADMQSLISDGRKYSVMMAELSGKYEDSFWALDYSQLRIAWKENEMKWFLPKALGRRKLVRSLAVHAKDTSSVNAQNYSDIISMLEEVANLRRSIQQSAAANIVGTMWNGEKTDFDRLDRAFNATGSLMQKQNFSVYSHAVVRILSDKNAMENVRKNIAVLDNYLENAGKIGQEYSLDLSAQKAAEDYFSTLREASLRWNGSISALRERSSLENALNGLEKAGLKCVEEAVRAGKVSGEDIVPAFEYSFDRGIIYSAFRKDPGLAQFNQAQYEDKINSYRETIKQYRSLTIQELAARLSAKIPNVSAGTTGNSEVAVLQRAIRSGGRMTPIRKLFDSIPALLRRICPCMLMSPISVAQYIDPNFPKFDLVIFDEASQLPTSEAVGAIARGDNVVVVGDPKQLPPTSFFSANRIDEENFEHEDLESLLDDCLALGMPQEHLLWHYRSRHESLIAFSNAKFYDNKLLTFPSPSDQISEVKWVNVPGVYDKGKTKQNRAEAEAIIAEVERRLSDENLRRDSIGIVTFSSVQQNLIDDLLSELYIRRPELETAANEMYEPIFIKNLENVQGDERDVILFSVCYGPDRDGRVSMNFGPLNRDGGWRRLNVAVSRARKGMAVYSTIRPDQIDLSRTRSEGVAQLKAFLEYAAKGRSALAVGASASAAAEDGFAGAVAADLEKYGYTVKRGIGCSGFRIDLAVADPQDDTYILGILCDNSHLYESTTARDRNIVQPSVLGGLGWKLCSVHVMDWLDNRDSVIARIVSAVEAARAEKKNNVRPEPEKQPEKVPELAQMNRCESVELKTEKYIPARLPIMSTAERFYEDSSLPKIARAINRVLDAEAPISRKLLLKNTIAAWGINRSGSRVEEIFDRALRASGARSTQYGGQIYVWKNGQSPDKYDAVRLAAGTEKRSVEDVPPEEIAVAVRYVLSKQFSMPYSDLVRETAKAIGYTRGANVDKQIGYAVDIAVSRGWAERQEDKVTLSD